MVREEINLQPLNQIPGEAIGVVEKIKLFTEDGG